MAQTHATAPPASHPQPGAACAVLLPLPLAGCYDYRVPAGLAVAPGDFVLVPLGPRRLAGVVWGPGSGQVEEKKLKEIISLIDMPPMTAELRGLIDWAANYTLNAPGAMLRMAMSVPSALEPARPVTGYRLADAARVAPESAVIKLGDSDGIRLTAARARLLEALAQGGPPRPAADLARAAGVSAAVVRGLADAGVLTPVSLGPPPFPAPSPAHRDAVTLSPAQSAAAASLTEAFGDDQARPAPTLLDGVTGAGKTEVYFEALAACLEAGRQALVMLPEIALTADWLRRFERRFGTVPAVWHSEISQSERRRVWRAVARGDARIVVGARSALFLPFAALGLIVVDEEHDASYKQEDGAIYNARDMAVVRGQLGKFPVVLVSATPSLETLTNVARGRYRRIALPERHGGASLPEISAIDMRTETLGRQSWLSAPLRDALIETVAAGEQAMLFLNRRGYAPLTLCRACGHRFQCPNCSAWLVSHRLIGRLQCHHCGFSTPPPPECPSCGAADMLAACGPGVERIFEEVTALLPDARIAIMASDTVRGSGGAADLLDRMRAREIDVLIGTQVVAKGHHFPFLTLVGVIDADLGLAGGDLRAAERTYQLLHQVAGRAGREARAGRVLVQTYQPDHPVMAALIAHDRDRFLAAESDARRQLGMPPFGRLAAVILSGPHEERVAAAARALALAAPRMDGLDVLGPAPAPLSLLRGRHRWRLLVKARRDLDVQAVLRAWLGAVKLPSGVRRQVDVDPYSFV